MFASGYAGVYDQCNLGKPYKKEIEFVYAWANKPKWILDVGCGTCSYWKYYPKDTYLFGVDRSPAMALQGKTVVCADIEDYRAIGRYDCATALFDVINYIPRHGWWKNLPLEEGKFWVFDIFDKKKVDKEGFTKTVKVMKNSRRTITPIKYDGKVVDLEIKVEGDDFMFKENHRMYVFSHKDIVKFCGKDFKIVEVKDTPKWQRWYKCQKR